RSVFYLGLRLQWVDITGFILSVDRPVLLAPDHQSFQSVRGWEWPHHGRFHVAVVRDDSAKTVTMYVNSQVDGTATYTGSVINLQGNKRLGVGGTFLG